MTAAREACRELRCMVEAINADRAARPFLIASKNCHPGCAHNETRSPATGSPCARPFAIQEDAMGIRDRHIIGVDNLLWGSDYPHVESTFPRSRQIIEEVLTDCSEEEKAKIAGGNAARIYHLN